MNVRVELGTQPSSIPLLGRARTRAATRFVLMALPAVALTVLFVITGVRGVNFGYHWDEFDGQLKPARQMLESGILLPHVEPYSYNYPALCRWLVLLPTLPAGLRVGLATDFDPQRVQAAMLAAFDAPGFLMGLRRTFTVVSALGILWVYGAALALRMKWWVAFVAAAGLGLSWEYAYHSRFVATDCVLTQFAALTLLMIALFYRTKRDAWLYAAALSAGLCTGTKYPGVFLLVPVALTSLLIAPPRGFFANTGRMALVGILSFVAYVVTTPGTLLDPFTFISETRFISKYYAAGTHGGYTVATAGEHGVIALSFLAFAYFSPYPALAVLQFGGSLAGAALWLKNDRRLGLVLVSFPVLFLLYFCSKYRLVTVRNYLFVAPFFSLLLAGGVAMLNRRISHGRLRAVLAGALALALTLEAAWLVRAGESIRNVDPKRYVREAIAHIEAHPSVRFRLSNRVLTLAAEQQLRLPSNVVSSSAPDRVVFFAASEGPDQWDWKTNDPWLTTAVFGPAEMNFNWYSSWGGHDRVVVMRRDKALATNVPIAN